MTQKQKRSFLDSVPLVTIPKDNGVWKDAPVLTGSTNFEPLPNVKNIMITGGAGFM